VATVIAISPHLLYMSLVAGFIGVLSWNMGNKIITPLNGVLFILKTAVTPSPKRPTDHKLVVVAE